MENLFFATITEEGLPKWSNERDVKQALIRWKLKAVYAKFWRMTGQRTEQQNKSLHLYCEMLAKELNDAGISIQLFLKETVELEFTKDSVKELIWRPVQKALTGKDSTTKLDKVSDIGTIYEHLNRHVGEKFHIHIPWPSEETKL